MSNILCFDVKGNSMSPTYKDGDSISLSKFEGNKIKVNEIVVCSHPFKTNLKILKRVTKIKDGTKLFLEGDNINVSSSEDSHNFGYIDKSNVIAIKRI